MDYCCHFGSSVAAGFGWRDCRKPKYVLLVIAVIVAVIEAVAGKGSGYREQISWLLC